VCQVGAVPVQVIVLNGGSSSGTTSVGRAQQTHLPKPHLPLGVDTLIDAMPTPRPGRHDAPISVDADRTARPGPTFRTLEKAWYRGVELNRVGAPAGAPPADLSLRPS